MKGHVGPAQPLGAAGRLSPTKASALEPPGPLCSHPGASPDLGPQAGAGFSHHLVQTSSWGRTASHLHGWDSPHEVAPGSLPALEA